MGMQKTKRLKRILGLFLVFFIWFAELQGVTTIYASDLSFYNHNTKSTVKYNNSNIVTFVYNNKEISLDYPGIILSGTTLADYEDFFVKELGLSATISEKTITLSDGETEIIFTVGSKTVKVNGKSEKLSVAPAKLEFSDGVIKYYIPTRFVAENFGYNYVFDSKKSEAILTKSIQLQINGKTTLYNDAFYELNYNNGAILSDVLVFSYKNTVYAPAKLLTNALSCQYTENKQITFSKNNITLQMETGLYSVWANDFSFDIDAAPILVSNQTYIPLETTLNLLGYKWEYNEESCSYHISETEYTGVPELHPDLKQYYKTIQVELEQEPITTYFTWTSNDSQTKKGFKNLSKIKAYSIKNADVLELYGINRDDVFDYIDTRALVFELNSVASNMETKFYADFEAPHLNYTLVTNVNGHTKIFMMIPIEDEWVFEETKECLKIYFMPSELSEKDLHVYEEKTVAVEQTDKNITYPDNQFVILLPETIDFSQVQIQDNYYDNNIQITLPGDLTDYFCNNAPINPYDFVTDVVVTYDNDKNLTIISCKTKYICGFETIYNGTYLALRMGKPSEIYDKIIVLDAGHGGNDPGAVNNDIYEKDINLSILNYTKELFENSDIKVYYTRTTDKYLSLEKRAKFSKNVTADLFISLHINASELNNISGTEVYYSGSNNKETYYGLTSKKIAQVLVNNLYVAMDSKLRGTIQNNFYVTQYNSVPAVLIELGFISNPEECAKLTDKTYQEKAAKAIYDSVIEIFSAYPTVR